ncbi:MAG: sulfatase-like hydrolase/transferase, partial [Promethearchaeota archaeon]
ACRADHLGCYGYNRNTSPNLDEFAKDSILFLNAFSQSHWTLPTHMSMFTSLYPSSHEIYLNRRLDKNIKTLPQILRKNGYQCYGFVSHLRLSPNYGYSRGFDYYIYKEYDRWKEQATAEDIILKTIKYLNENCHRNNFIFLHFFDIHSPYIPSNNYYLKFNPIYRGKITGRERDLDLFQKPLKNIFTKPLNYIPKRDFEHIVALYDGEILHLDELLGMLFDKLKHLNIYDDSLIIITADHGEELFDHENMGHNTIYDEIIKIPLMIKLPSSFNISGMKIHHLVQGNIDLYPTILDLAEISIPSSIQGKTLVPLINKEKFPEYQHVNEVFSERVSNWNLQEYGIAIRTLKYKYIYTTHFDITKFTNFKREDEIKELYDLTNDPLEKNNISEEKPEISKIFQERINKFVQNTLKKLEYKEKSRLDEQLQKLKQLGRI